MLNNDRKYFVTASQCHRVMAGYELELEGMNMDVPVFDSFPQVYDWIKKNNREPKVGELKAAGITASGKEIKEAWRYIKATTPVFSEGMESVAREIAMSKFIKERDESYKSVDMERGNIQEGEAIIKLQDITGREFSNTNEDQIFLSDDCLGVTPDGIEYDGFDIVSCAEVKAPKDTTHMKYLSLIKDERSFREVVPIYYWQAQCGLAVTGAESYHWLSYHNGFDDDYQAVYLEVKPNKYHIDLLRIRAKRVLDAVPVIVDDIINRYTSHP